MLPLLGLIISLILLILGFWHIEKVSFYRVSPLVLLGLAPCLLVLALCIIGWPITYMKASNAIREYSEMYSDMPRVCPAINSEYEHFTIKTKMLHLRDAVAGYENVNFGWFEYAVPDTISTLHILSNKEIDDCAMIKDMCGDF
jgi:uncharacterized membrane protein